MTAVADIRKVQADISYKGEHQTLTKQGMRHQICPGETCHTTISEPSITFRNSDIEIELFCNKTGSGSWPGELWPMVRILTQFVFCVRIPRVCPFSNHWGIILTSCITFKKRSRSYLWWCLQLIYCCCAVIRYSEEQPAYHTLSWHSCCHTTHTHTHTHTLTLTLPVYNLYKTFTLWYANTFHLYIHFQFWIYRWCTNYASIVCMATSGTITSTINMTSKTSLFIYPLIYMPAVLIAGSWWGCSNHWSQTLINTHMFGRQVRTPTCSV